MHAFNWDSHQHQQPSHYHLNCSVARPPSVGASLVPHNREAYLHLLDPSCMDR